jgi:hypothetical protein
MEVEASPVVVANLRADLTTSTSMSTSESLSMRDDATPLSSSEIVSATRSGGANTSHTIVVPALRQLLKSVPVDADIADYERAALFDNVLGKETAGARKRTFRYLKELYLLRADSILFRALRDLWTDDASGQPLLAGLCALARDTVFRASAGAIFETDPGDVLSNANLADAVARVYPDVYNEPTLAKIGRNTFSSWEQTGHLEPGAKREKIRRRAVCTASTTGFALMLGHLEGVRGEALFETFWARALDQPRSHLLELAAVASQKGLIDFRRSGGITEVGFTELRRPIEGWLT